MKIKCPFCKNIYDPEACDNTCPACNKKLLVTVFKKKPEGKPGAAPATTIRPPTTVTPKPPAPAPAAPPPPPPAPKPVPPPPPVAPKPDEEFVAPKPAVISHISKKTTTKVTADAVAPTKLVAPPPPPAPAPEPVPVPVIKAKVVVAPPPEPVAPVVSAPPPPPPPAPALVPAPAPHAEKKHAQHGHGHAKAGLDVVISIQRGESKDWDAVIRVPLQVFKLANLIPARAREAITSEGIDLEELRKAVEHMDHAGRLLDIQTQAERVHIAIEPHG